MAAIAAVVAAPSGAVDVDTGALLGLKGLVAALIVRFGSPLRAMVAGPRPRARRGDDRERAHRLVRARRRRTARCCRSRSSCSSSRCGPSWKPSRSSSDGARRPHRRRARRGGPRRCARLDAPAHGGCGARRARRARPGGRAVVGARRLAGERLLPRARGDGPLARRSRSAGCRRSDRARSWRSARSPSRCSRAKAGWPVLPATLVAVAAAAAGGVLAGAGVVRLRPVFIAVTTWILTWAVTIFLLAFRSVLGRRAGARAADGHLRHRALRARPRAARRRGARLGRRSRRRGPGIELRAARQVPAAAPRSASRPRGGVSARSSPRPRSAVSPARSPCSSQVSRTRASTGRTSPSSSSSRCCSAGSPRRSAPPPGSRGSRSSPAPPAARRPRRCRVGALRPDARGAAPARRARARRRRDRPAAAQVRRAKGGAAGAPGIGARLLPPPSGSRARGPPILVAESLTKRFGSLVAADAVSLELVPGEVCALIGPNGSGKTTVLRLLAGVYRPDAGRVSSTAPISATRRRASERRSASCARSRPPRRSAT